MFAVVHALKISPSSLISGICLNINYFSFDFLGILISLLQLCDMCQFFFNIILFCPSNYAFFFT
jgi:hypothetical protein